MGAVLTSVCGTPKHPHHTDRLWRACYDEYADLIFQRDELKKPLMPIQQLFVDCYELRIDRKKHQNKVAKDGAAIGRVDPSIQQRNSMSSSIGDKKALFRPFQHWCHSVEMGKQERMIQEKTQQRKRQAIQQLMEPQQRSEEEEKSGDYLSELDIDSNTEGDDETVDKGSVMKMMMMRMQRCDGDGQSKQTTKFDDWWKSQTGEEWVDGETAWLTESEERKIKEEACRWGVIEGWDPKFEPILRHTIRKCMAVEMSGQPRKSFVRVVKALQKYCEVGIE